MLETIKSYLVSLGFAVDKQSYNEATKAIDSAGQGIAKFGGTAVKNFALAGAAVTSFVAGASLGIAKFVDGLGKAAIQNEMLARQMWTTEKNAMAFNSTLKAMGVSLQDLYLSPTLMHQFQQLRKEAVNLQAPAEYKSQMKLVQSISFEFKRMKLEATYALQWIGYYFIKYMSGPIHDIKKTLGDINGIIVKTMPSWTKVIAQVMSWFARMGIVSVRAFKDIIRVFDQLGQGIPKNLKLIAGAAAAVGTIIATGPIGIIAAVILAAILLLDDFYTYLDGGESALGPFWKKLTGLGDTLSETFDKVKKSIAGFIDDLNKNGTLDNLEKTFTNTFDIINKIIDGAKGWVKDLWAELEKQGVLTDLKTNFEGVLAAVSNLYSTVTELIDKFLGLAGTKTTLTDIGKILNDVIIVALKTINGLLLSISDMVNATSSVLDGTVLKKGEQAGESARDRLEKRPDAVNHPGVKGMFGDMWRDFRHMITDPFTGDNLLRERLLVASGNVSKALSYGFSPGGKPKSPNYLYPQSNMQTSNNKVTLNQTNNIQGSDPNATAAAAQENFKDFAIRGLRGLIK